MSQNRLPEWFPWVAAPCIANGPMFGAASSALAAEVTKAGGIGFLPSTIDLSSGSAHLQTLDADLADCAERLGHVAGDTKPLPVGASFLTALPSVADFATTALPIVKKHRPAAVWLFAPGTELRPHGSIIQALKELEVPPKVFIQVGNVAAAREAVQDGADVLVCQGTDAGGHQFRKGAGIGVLVPEVKMMLAAEFGDRDIAVLAAGGIADGRGAAAAMALGAEGVVMGTRFTVCPESVYPDFRKELVLKTMDGASSTLKSAFNDEITSSKVWGSLYDGRAIVGPIHEMFLAGSSLQECQRSLKEDYPAQEATRIINTWAGAGVGLVNKAQPAGDIVREVREGAKETIRMLAGLL
ncbi:2-nitropropane dioxygenase [Stachybotrys elegans]|uniref:2-nitropropane dioxygenase n=1 Tax=Stachybotrys elegans TaxID=80388 RepID=A0A8K0SZE0_9HYPO|nr:2-nitropropane dioxygenase [Stachybotrys elegans]